jgi:hypothetical protein
LISPVPPLIVLPKKSGAEFCGVSLIQFVQRVFVILGIIHDSFDHKEPLATLADVLGLARVHVPRVPVAVT